MKTETSTAADLMHEGLISCEPGAPLGEVARLLRANQVHSLVVIDPSSGGAVGVISDTDLLAGEWLATDPERLAVMAKMTAGDLMSKPAITISGSAAVPEAVELMRSNHVARLLVELDGRPAGVLAISDVVAQVAASHPRRGKVRDAMSWGIAVCHAGTPLDAAARAMIERRTRSLVVVDGSGRALGVVTGFDLLGVAGEPASKLGSATVDSLMHPPISIAPDASLDEAADAMLTHEIHRLLVVDPSMPEGLPMGLISTSDIVAVMAGPGSAWQPGRE